MKKYWIMALLCLQACKHWSEPKPIKIVAEEPAPEAFDGASDDVWVAALEGYHKFKTQYPLGSALMQALSEGQEPQIMMVGCADSRVDPALLLQTRPGDLFVVRNVANIVSPYDKKDTCPHSSGAAIEYGVTALNVQHLVLMGHSKCGGVKGVLTGVEGDLYISDWIAQIKSILPKGYKPNPHVTDEEVNHYAKEALKKSYQNSMALPFVKKAVEDKKLVVHVWFYDIENNKIQMLAKDKPGRPWQDLDEEVLNRFLDSKRKRG